MSPLKGILVSGRGRALASVSYGAALCACLVLALTLSPRAALAAVSGDADAIKEGDARKAEKILAKLRLLHDAAEAEDENAFHALASKLYPGLFRRVAELRPGDLSTDLSTAVFLADELGRKWFGVGNATADCRSERPDIYAPLCAALRGGTVRQMLLAKSRLHARWAEAVLRSYKGEADTETLRVLMEMKTARANDALIAARVVEELRPLQRLAPNDESGERRSRFKTSPDGTGNAGSVFEEALREASALLAWMPRSQAFYQLSNARGAYADGLWWRGKARQAKSLVVSANNFQPDPLEALRLNATQVNAAADANLMSAAKRVRLAEQTLSRPSR